MQYVIYTLAFLFDLRCQSGTLLNITLALGYIYSYWFSYVLTLLTCLLDLEVLGKAGYRMGKGSSFYIFVQTCLLTL